MLDFRIETFLTVCKHLNYTAAAKELHMTQPAVSGHIHFLEEQYQCKLFTYNKKKLSLTKAGEILLQRIHTWKSDEELMLSEMNASEETPFEYFFGATMTVTDYALITPLKRFLNNHPKGNLFITRANTNQLLDQLRNHKISFAIVEGYFPKREFDSKLYSSERYIAVCNNSHQFQKQGTSLKSLLGERLLVREPGSGSREILENSLLAHGIQIADFEHRIEINSVHAIIELLKEDCGIAFLYETAVKKELSCGTLCEIPLSDFHIEHDFSFIWNKNSHYSEEYISLCSEFSRKNYEKE